jgi:3-oxoadipate enol-lactonase
MAFKRLGDIVVHHEVTGPARAPALVLVNSLGTDFRVWNALAPFLAERFRLIAYDKRGHGLTDVPAGPYTIAGLAGDLGRLLDFLEVREAVICGLSIGGMIAQQLAAARPELVRGLVLMDTAHKIGAAALWQDRIEAVQSRGIASIADGILQRWFARPFHEERADELAGWRNMLVRTPAVGYAACCAAIRDADLTAAAAAIKVPTLCLVGADDGATPSTLVQELASLIPGARFREIAAAGHLPCVEQPDAVASTMLQFFEETNLAR